MSYNSTNMKHYWGMWDFILLLAPIKTAFHVINYCRVRFTSAPAKTRSYQSSLWDTHFSYFSSLEERGISILHQVWSWASGLMSQMVSRRQPIYRLVCMVDVTSGVSVVHQSPATQHGPTSGRQQLYADSPCLPLCGCLSPHQDFLFCLVLLSVCCLRAADVQPCSARKKDYLQAFVWWCCLDKED